VKKASCDGHETAQIYLPGEVLIEQEEILKGA
jgi:hypothetical protein